MRRVFLACVLSGRFADSKEIHQRTPTSSLLGAALVEEERRVAVRAAVLVVRAAERADVQVAGDNAPLEQLQRVRGGRAVKGGKRGERFDAVPPPRVDVAARNEPAPLRSAKCVGGARSPLLVLRTTNGIDVAALRVCRVAPRSPPPFQNSLTVSCE